MRNKIGGEKKLPDEEQVDTEKDRNKTTQALNQTLNETLNHTNPFSVRVRQIARMGVRTNLGRKSVTESKNCRLVVAGEPLPSPSGELLEEGAKQEERKKMRRGRRNGGKGKEGTSNMFFSMAVVVDDDLFN